jgi:hypothetical protein
MWKLEWGAGLEGGGEVEDAVGLSGDAGVTIRCRVHQRLGEKCNCMCLVEQKTKRSRIVAPPPPKKYIRDLFKIP